MAIFKGSGVALVTPMKENGQINYDALEALIEDQLANHTDAFIICGTTGEAPTLEDDEHLEAIGRSVEIIKGRAPVIAGTGSNNTAHAVMMSEESEKLGADAVLLVTPYYNKTTQDGLYAHYRTIAAGTKLPCIIYNVPSRTGTNILPSTMARLARDTENIVAIKEASGNISQVAELAATDAFRDGCFDIYSGNDDQVIPICSLGGIGVISVLADVAPRQTHDMVSLYGHPAARQRALQGPLLRSQSHPGQGRPQHAGLQRGQSQTAPGRDDRRGQGKAEKGHGRIRRPLMTGRSRPL